jgi:hypothetical protein
MRQVLPLALAVLLAIVSLAVPGSSMPTAAQEPDASADMLILLDVTRSMAGAEGSQNIWVPIRTAAEDTVSATAPGTRLGIVPFADGPQWPRIFPGPVPENGDVNPLTVRTNADRDAAKAHLRGLVPDGRATYIHASLRYALRQLERWRAGQPNRPQTLMLFTDGDDNSSESGLGLAGICAQFGSPAGSGISR